MRRLCATLVLAMLVAGSARAQVVPHELPLPVTAAHIDEMLSRANIDPSVADAVRGVHRQYFQDWQTEFGPFAAELRRMVARINNMSRHRDEFVDGHTTVSLVEAYREQTASLRPQLAAANDALWRDIETLLAQEQHQWIERARLSHARAEFQLRPAEIRERHIDLMRLLEPMMQRQKAAIR